MERISRKSPKILIHEHLDCSPRPATMLELWEEIGFEKASIPQNILATWRGDNVTTTGAGRKSALLAARTRAAKKYQQWLVGFASASLANYVEAIVKHILPLMQTEKNLERITRERMEDAIADGVIAFELRFAPQLHTWSGLTLEQVMDATLAGVRSGCAGSDMKCKLIICALRHEDASMAMKLVDLVVKYQQYVAAYDLAADEHARPGVLAWWLSSFLVLLAKLELENKPFMGRTIHLWETDAPTAGDIEMLEVLEGKNPTKLKELFDAALAEHGINLGAEYDRVFTGVLRRLKEHGKASRIGHGIRGNRQKNRICEVSPTSNVVTGQVKSMRHHQIDKMHRRRKRVCVNTDGTLFTEVQLTDEYNKLVEAFGWTKADFLAVNLTALEASSFSAEDKKAMEAKLRRAYR